MRPHVEPFGANAGVPDMLDDVHQAQFIDGREKEIEAATQAFYNMMDSAQKPLHDQSMMSKLDVIERLMGLKSELNLVKKAERS